MLDFARDFALKFTSVFAVQFLAHHFNVRTSSPPAENTARSPLKATCNTRTCGLRRTGLCAAQYLSTSAIVIGHAVCPKRTVLSRNLKRCLEITHTKLAIYIARPLGAESNASYSANKSKTSSHLNATLVPGSAPSASLIPAARFENAQPPRPWSGRPWPRRFGVSFVPSQPTLYCPSLAVVMAVG